MLSAVENFGPAAAATHAYAHHHNFSIAAAAAAAGTAAAAAAAVIPSQQAALEHSHHHMLAAHSALNSGGLLLPSTQLSAPLPEVAVTMSSAEFLRPHPKPLRHNGLAGGSGNNSTGNPSGSPNSGNNTNGNSNGIPLHGRGSKVGGGSLNLGNAASPRSKYSLDQAGPVNLVTSNNNSNCSSSGGGNSSTPPMKSSPSDQHPPPHSPSEREREMMAGILAAQKMPFPSSEAASAAVYQYSRALAANRSFYTDPSYFVTSQLVRAQLHPDRHIYPYLHPSPSAYSPPGAPPLLGPPPAPAVAATQLVSPHSASTLLSSSHNSPTGSSLSTTQLPVMPERHPHAPAAPPSLHLPSPPHLPQPSAMGVDRQPVSYPKEKDLKNISQLNGKTNIMLENQAGFKVPSGKEGSMKHRILTRPPYGEKDVGRHRSPISAAVFRNSSNINSPTNFTKGSLIELSTGELRRVEDMRTEDFVQSAERSQHLELADSTVVKITPNSHNVTITFSYNKNRSKVDIDASAEHPFFVYGQGWASYNPELTLKTYGLKCQRLQVGDVCISLKPRESSSSTSSSSSSNSYPSTPQSPTNYASPNQYKEEVGPQNLSRKSSSTSSNLQTTTIPTTATGTTVSSRLSGSMLSHMPPASHIPGITSYEMLHAYGTSPPVPSHNLHRISPPAAIPPQHHSHHQQHQLQRQKIEGHVVLARNPSGHHSSPSPTSSPANRPPSNHQPYYLGTSVTSDKCNGREPPTSSSGNAECNQLTHSDQQAAIDASTSRKRRWSWTNSPPNSNDEEHGPSPPKTVCNTNC